METFRIRENVEYATDINGVAVVNKTDNSHTFIRYPEAAVWLVLAENDDMKRSGSMIKAITGKNNSDLHTFLSDCLTNWRKINLIY